MEEVEISKPTWKPKFQSEFSMGELDFQRYNEWLKWCERWSAEINSTDNPSLEMIQKYFSGLNVLWKSWRPIVSSTTIKNKIDEAIKNTRKLKRFWERSFASNIEISKLKKNEIVDALDEIHAELMDIKQIIGLGVVVKKMMDAKERIRAGMRGGDYGGNLPEV